MGDEDVALISGASSIFMKVSTPEQWHPAQCPGNGETLPLKKVTMTVLSACMYTACIRCPWWPEEMVRSPGTGVTAGY